MTDDNKFDLFDADIDFETAYDMLDNTETFLSTILRSPKRILSNVPSESETYIGTIPQMLPSQHRYTKKMNDHVMETSKKERAETPSLDHSRSLSPKHPLTNDTLEQSLHEALAVPNIFTVSASQNSDDTLQAEGSYNYVPETRGKINSGSETYDLLSVNESNAIESFLDSLIDPRGSRKQIPPLKETPSLAQIKAESVEPQTNDIADPQPTYHTENIGKKEGNTDNSAYQELSAKYEMAMEKLNYQKKRHLISEKKRRASIKDNFDILLAHIKFPRKDGFHENQHKPRVKKYEYLQFVIEDIEDLIKANQELQVMIDDLGQ